MSGALRTGDNSKGPQAQSAADRGSPNVIINGRAAVRFGDGGSTWQLIGGARGVFINGRLAGREGDPTRHTDGDGIALSGSPNVEICNNVSVSGSTKPVLRIQVRLAEGPPLAGDEVDVLDSDGRVIASKTLDEEGKLDADVAWGCFRIRLKSGLLIRLR